jgi:hypothetical protein
MARPPSPSVDVAFNGEEHVDPVHQRLFPVPALL